jgi:hypothetical protein
LDLDNAKPLSGGGLHHHPAFQAIHHLRSQSRQAGYLSWNIVGFDIDMDPALMLDTLNLDNGLIRGRFQHTVVSACPRVIGVYGATQRIGPKPGGRINIRCVAVNQNSAEAGVVHKNPNEH